ncbi:hypothetical protein D046_4399B, partial [Vibrio parahaemolyticus V-223/04]
RQVY